MQRAIQFAKNIWGSPNPARWRARREREEAAPVPTPEPEPTPAEVHGHDVSGGAAASSPGDEVHGHGEHACYWCPSPASCDCPCETCIRCRHMHAGTACAACGSREGLLTQSSSRPAGTAEGVVERECADCRSGREEDEAEEPPRPDSWIQRQLDEEWANANFGGPGCPFCDATISCGCQARRSKMIAAAAREEERERRAAAGRIGCTCSYDGECEFCRARCDECGAYPDQPCRPGCGDHGEEDERDDRTEYGDCRGCTPGCYGCDPHFDPSDPWGDGAPEEHPGHPGYDGY